MALKMKYSPTVIRNDRGLTISGTRITLYQIMDFLKAGYSPEEVMNSFRLTIRQITDVIRYIEIHRDEVEAEYQHVLALAESNRQYWEERNRERLAQIAKKPPEPNYAELWRKLQAWRAHLNSAE